MMQAAIPNYLVALAKDGDSVPGDLDLANPVSETIAGTRLAA